MRVRVVVCVYVCTCVDNTPVCVSVCQRRQRQINETHAASEADRALFGVICHFDKF